MVYICCVFPGWCLYQLLFCRHCGGWCCSRARPQRRERRTRSPRRRQTWQKCEGTVLLFIYLVASASLWELLMFITHVFFQGKTRLTRCSGARGSQGKQGMVAHLLYHQIYKYMHGVVSLSLTASHLCCPLPPLGRCWSHRHWTSRTTSKADVSL